MKAKVGNKRPVIRERGFSKSEEKEMNALYYTFRISPHFSRPGTS